jgi:hypothetical protein
MDLLVVAVLLVNHALNFHLHKLNANPDAVDSGRHTVHLAVKAPKVVKNLVVLLDGLELHGLCRASLVPYKNCNRARRERTCKPTCSRSTSLRSFSTIASLSAENSVAPKI